MYSLAKPWLTGKGDMSKDRGASNIFFKRPSRQVSFTGQPSVLELALANRLPIEHSCGGMGTCGTCRIFVNLKQGQLPERNEVEAEMARDRNFLPHERLACQLTALDGLEVSLPDSALF